MKFLQIVTIISCLLSVTIGDHDFLDLDRYLELIGNEQQRLFFESDQVSNRMKFKTNSIDSEIPWMVSV